MLSKVTEQARPARRVVADVRADGGPETSLGLASILALQRQAGNRATASYLSTLIEGDQPVLGRRLQCFRHDSCEGGGGAPVQGRNDGEVSVQRDGPTSGTAEQEQTSDLGPTSSTDPAAASGSGPGPGSGDGPTPEVCPPPSSLASPPSSSEPTAVDATAVFTKSSAVLTPAAQAIIDGVAARLGATQTSVVVRIDGYASAEGPCTLNWGLSSDRAAAVVAELANPSDGSPGVAAVNIQAFSHGESNAAGPDLASNRRATISIPDVPPPPPPPQPVCSFPVTLGIGRHAYASGTDFTHNDHPSVSMESTLKMSAWAMALAQTPVRSAVPDLQAEGLMAAELGGLGGSAGLDAFSTFVGGAGTPVVHGSSSTLGAAALGAPSFLATVARVKAALEPQLAAQAAAGALDPCALTVAPVPATHFTFSDPLALKAVIGGTQGEELYATAFTGDAATRTYEISLRFVILDDFGVDENDLYSPGLIGFWVLQHERGAGAYAPFVNELDLTVSVSGTF